MENVIATSLGLAARLGHSSELRRLLDAGHHVYNADNRGYTPLHEAAEAGHEECCELLLREDDCDPNARTHEGYTALYLVCRYQEKPSLISLLVRFGADCNLADNENTTPLHIASSENIIEMVCELLKHKANISPKDYSGYTPLHNAVCKGQVPIVNELLKHGADPDIGDEFNVTPLYLAVQGGWKGCVEVLIQHGASVNESTEDGMTPLMAASQDRCKTEVALKLLQHGADPDLENNRRLLALSLAVHNGCTKLVKILLERTSRDVIIRNSSLAPYELVSLPCLAIDTNSLDCLKIIMETDLGDTVKNAPISINYLPVSSPVPFTRISPLGLLLASYPDQESMVDLLLSQGCSVNATSRDEMPPIVGLILAECSFKEKQVCLRKLLRNGCNVDYCTVPPGGRFDCGLPVAVLVACCSRTLRRSDSDLMLRTLFECSVACDADEILAWKRKENQFAYDIALNVLREFLMKPWDSTDFFLPVYPLQGLARCAVRKWLWNTLHDSSKVKNVFDTLRIPLIIQEYVIGKAWIDAFK